MMLMVVLMAGTAATAQVPPSEQGCRFVAPDARAVIVFEDTDINDDGDFLASLRLEPQQASKLVVPRGQTVRYKVRNHQKARWWSGGRVACSRGAVISVR